MASNSMADDEAYAMQLQAQEMGLAAPSNNANQQLRQQQRANQQAMQQQMRMNMAGNVLNRQVRGSNRTNPKTAAIVTCIVCLPQIIAGAIVLTMNWNPSVCDKPIHLWSLVTVIRLALYTICMVILAAETTTIPSRMSQVGQAANCLKHPLEIVAFFWFIFGNIWILTSRNCGDNSPAVYRLATAFLAIHYIIILLPCLLVILLMPFLCCCLPCFLRVASNTPFAPRGADRPALERLPASVFRAAEADESDKTCCICLVDYEEGEEIRRLPCGGNHHFHKKCVDEWLQLNATCPQCRGKVFDDDGNVRVVSVELGQPLTASATETGTATTTATAPATAPPAYGAGAPTTAATVAL